MCWGLTYSRCIVGLIWQRGRLLLLWCSVENIKPAELQQPEGITLDREVWMEKFGVFVFSRTRRPWCDWFVESQRGGCLLLQISKNICTFVTRNMYKVYILSPSLIPPPPVYAPRWSSTVHQLENDHVTSLFYFHVVLRCQRITGT